jgi:hypothetical protein
VKGDEPISFLTGWMKKDIYYQVQVDLGKGFSGKNEGKNNFFDPGVKDERYRCLYGDTQPARTVAPSDGPG